MEEFKIESKTCKGKICFKLQGFIETFFTILDVHLNVCLYVSKSEVYILKLIEILVKLITKNHIF